nr:hypothetical protein BaRGS_033784 [Batillaria attramentaria]
MNAFTTLLALVAVGLLQSILVESYPTTLNELLGVSGWANDMDNALSFQCPSGQSINAIVSYHHNHYEDRRWKFACKGHSWHH